MEQDNNNQLNISYKNIDKVAFKLLFKEHYKAVFNHLFFNCSNYELSRDLTQDTFYKLWEQRTNIKDTKSILPFLFKIAKNLLLDHYRHRKVEQKYVEQELKNEPLEESLESQTNTIILEEKIREIVRTQMNAKTQLIFMLSRFDGKSNDEISESLGVSKKTIENQLYIALSILREKLKPFLISVLIWLNVFNLKI